MTHNGDNIAGSDWLRVRAEERLKERVTECDGGKSVGEDAQSTLHELEVHQIELEMQNEELRRVQDELESNRNRYAFLFESAPVGYLILNDKGVIRDINIAGMLLLKREKTALLNFPLARFLSKEGADILHCHLAKLFQSRQTQTCEVDIPRKDGRHLFVKLNSIFISGDEEDEPYLCLTAATDITKLVETTKFVQEALDLIKLELAHAVGNGIKTVRDGILPQSTAVSESEQFQVALATANKLIEHANVLYTNVFKTLVPTDSIDGITYAFFPTPPEVPADSSLQVSAGEKTVFLVDDSKGDSFLITRMLDAHGWNVELFDSAEAFLVGCHPGRTGCLLLDFQLPGKNGLELLMELKARAYTIPVVILTGNSNTALVVQALHAGAI
ncbi:MAG: response regulator, partial [Alphaproteobacteria bacterium]|nr:response regulator [Alphaproteobacteria bacterium]